ncbi:MAG: hypothetical protein KDE27_08515 [Planctomycetes bacterium]|nr:hypothetical protein [Planctomycetota bacterium]
MARVFTLPWKNITIAGATTLAYLRPSATVPIEIVEVRIGFSTNSTSAMQRVELVRQVVSGSPASTATSPVNLDQGLTQACSITGGSGNMAAGTGGVNVSTEASGARTTLVPDTFNHTTGFIWVPGPDGPIRMAAGSSSIFGVYLPSAPSVLTGWSGCVTFLER